MFRCNHTWAFNTSGLFIAKWSLKQAHTSLRWNARKRSYAKTCTHLPTLLPAQPRAQVVELREQLVASVELGQSHYKKMHELRARQQHVKALVRLHLSPLPFCVCALSAYTSMLEMYLRIRVTICMIAGAYVY